MSKYNALVSVVIVNYNGLKYLRQCLTSLLRSNYPFYEIIMVDNGSTDDSVNIIKTEFEQYRDKISIIQLPDNRGFSIGNRLGADHAVGDYIFFLNNDTTVEPSCLGELVKLMDDDVTIGVAQAKILLMDKPDTFDAAGFCMSVFGIALPRGEYEKDFGQFDRRDEISYAKGAAMIVKRKLWTKLEGFESMFFVYFEESDFCWRVWLSGFRVVFAPSARVYHVCAATTVKFVSHFLMFEFYRNQIVMLVKNLSLKSLAKYSPGVVSVHLIQTLIHIRRNEPGSVVGMLRAISWCLFFFSRVWAKRHFVQDIRVVKDKDLFERGVISRRLFL
jgi:GT2 family glycosyltransferase